MVSVSLVSAVFLLSLKLAWCLESWEKPFVEFKTLHGVVLNILKSNVGRNTALSPFVFRFTLCKLAVAAIGETKKELLSFLEIWRPIDANKCFTDVFDDIYSVMETDMTLFNKIYVNYTDDFNQTFFTDSTLHGVSVSKVGYFFKQGAVNYVNNEMNAKTYKRLANVLESNDINHNSSMLLVNGVQMKPTWEQRFDIKKTGKKGFHLLNHTVIKIPMMNSVIQCSYMADEDESYSAISMHLAIYGLTATFIVTDPSKNIKDLFTILSHKPDALEIIKMRMKWETVEVFLPRFKIRMGLDWMEYMKMSGLNLIFNSSQSDLNGILKKKTSYNMFVSVAKQKVFVDIDEMGNHRHGAGGDLMEAAREGRLVTPTFGGVPQFVADRPFFFSISIATRSGTTIELVNGAYYGPQEADLQPYV